MNANLRHRTTHGRAACTAVFAIGCACVAAAADKVDFVRDVEPLLRKSCYSCHGPEKQESGLRLDDRERAKVGGDGGAAFVPGKSAESRLIRLVAGLDKDAGRMPPDGEGTPLTEEQINLLRAWIDQGADWPATMTSKSAGTDHWSLQPLRRPSLPAVSDSAWLRGPIDSFVLAKLDAMKIAPSPAAERATRRRHRASR